MAERGLLDATVNAENPQPAACRPFRLSDAMILIVGLALVFTMGGNLLKMFAIHFVQVCWILVVDEETRENWPRLLSLVRDPLRTTAFYGYHFAATILVGMTLSFLMLRLLRPRPPWRALIVQPGTVAALAIVVGATWVNGWVQILLPHRIDSFRGPWIAVGATVTAAWVVLALSRRWNAEPGWIERMGRALGALAIGIALLRPVVYWF